MGKAGEIPEDNGDYLSYDESSPSFLVWKKKSSKCVRVVVGGMAGYLAGVGNDRYHVKFRKKIYPVCRIIYFILNGELCCDLEIDHINGNPLDNRVENLRAVTSSKNARNLKKNKNNKTGFNGVSHSLLGKGKPYYHATWYEDRKKRGKAFSVTLLGEEEALKQAVEYREKQILRLNEKGYGYTEDHGKR